MKPSFLPILLLFCTACIQLGGETHPQHYHLLTPQAEIITGNSAALTLLFGPVDFPAYLDRPQLVTRNQQNELVIATSDRWGEPLQENLLRVLKENLQRGIDGLSISSYPWQSAADGGLLLKLTVNQFDGVLGQQTNVDIRWSLQDPATHQVLAQDHFISNLPIGDTSADLVSGLSRATAQLSTDIGQQLLQASK